MNIAPGTTTSAFAPLGGVGMHTSGVGANLMSGGNFGGAGGGPGFDDNKEKEDLKKKI